MPKAPVGDIEIHYEEAGVGEPLLFLSGLGRNLGSWALVVRQFQERWRCISYDHRGVGRSSVPPGPYSIEQLADDAAGLLDTLAVEAATCIGVSMGASVLQALSYRHPEKVAKAVLVSAFPNYTPVQHAWLDANLALRDSAASAEAAFVMNMPWVFTPRILSSHQGAVRYAELSLQDPHPTPIEGYRAHAQATRTFDSLKGLPGVQAETLVLVGAEDILTPVSQSVEIASAIPNATLQVLPRGGHGMVAEYMDDVVRAIKRFIER